MFITIPKNCKTLLNIKIFVKNFFALVKLKFNFEELTHGQQPKYIKHKKHASRKLQNATFKKFKAWIIITYIKIFPNIQRSKLYMAKLNSTSNFDYLKDTKLSE